MKLERITKEELKRGVDAGEAVVILDTRSSDAWDASDVQLPGAIRMPPDEIRQHLSEIPRGRPVVSYCT